VRFVCFGDIHMALRAIDRLAPELAGADAAILVGDLTNFGDPPDARQVVDAVRAHCPNVLAVTGNLDMPQVIDAFRADGISLHGEGRRLGPIGIFGCGGSNITPMDTPTELGEDEIRTTLERAHEAVADAPLAAHGLPHAAVRHPPRPARERHPRRQPRRARVHRGPSPRTSPSSATSTRAGAWTASATPWSRTAARSATAATSW
jgi:Icc-related predicted phosphoesterase